MSKIRILFMCIANSCRSQMAEALANHYYGDKIQAFSGGSNPVVVHPGTVKIMAELGIDISKARSKSVEEFIDEEFDYAISLCGDPVKGTCPVFPGRAKNSLHWPFPDPADSTGTEEEVMRSFREVRDAILNRIEEFIKQRSE
ncbi:MAG: arsenate reductase ArsC [Spirochaetes bacterium]|nr:arsenate reductase ArsC [Spirochaetota bacterium]